MIPDDLKDYRAPLGAFQLIAPALAEFLIILGGALILVFFVLPDIFAWIQGAQPVGVCQ